MPSRPSIGGFKLQVEDRTDLGYEALDAAMQAVTAKARQAPELAGIFTSYEINVPQLYAELDRTKAMQLGIDVQDVFAAMQIYLGSLYINDFNKFGRTYQVIAQADREFRSNRDDILRLQTRNSDGHMVPLGAVLRVSDTTGPESAMRYNAFRSADLNGGPAPGYSSGQAQEAITRILGQSKRIIMVENNQSGQFARLLRSGFDPASGGASSTTTLSTATPSARSLCRKVARLTPNTSLAWV